ncbi:MAG: hypothetical protein ACI4HI_09400 [Lachnospiraceae bacterium]
MNLKICSEKAYKTCLTKGFPENTAWIRFYDPPEEEQGVLNPTIFQAAVPDICYDELGEFGMNYETFFPQADALARFIRQAVEQKKAIVCQCTYGQSRSAGCAAAILEYYERTGITIFADYRYCPNQMLYHKVYDALQHTLQKN